MHIMSLQDFMKYFNVNKTITFSEFEQKAVTYRNILIKDWLRNFPQSDLRNQKQDEIMKVLYDIMVTNRFKNLEQWYNEHISISDENNYMKFKLDENILFGNTIKGKTKNLTRINKNLFFDDIYDTPKIGFNTKPTLFLTLKAIYEDYCLPRCWGLPMGIKKVLDNDIGGLYAILRGTENKASTFNPYTAGWILENMFHAKKVLTPVLDWNSYLIGFHNTNAEEYVGVDVIPKVVDTAREISKFYNDGKKTDFYLCPSEQLDERHNFSQIYSKHFDTIFGVPPYFELEKYRDGEQSITNFPTYESWLEGYWRTTCELCSKVITDDGHFGFVVSNYKAKNWVNISEDMLKVAEEFFNLDNHYLIGWNAFKVLDSEKMKKGNFENFYFMSLKK